MSVSVVLSVAGERDRVMYVLERVADYARRQSGCIWIDERNDPRALPQGAQYSGEVEVELEDARTRGEGIGAVNGFVNACDPGHEVVVDGDIFKRTLEDPVLE